MSQQSLRCICRSLFEGIKVWALVTYSCVMRLSSRGKYGTHFIKIEHSMDVHQCFFSQCCCDSGRGRVCVAAAAVLRHAVWTELKKCLTNKELKLHWAAR